MSVSVANLLGATAQLVDDAVREGIEREIHRTASAPAALVTIAHDSGLSIDALRAALGLTHSGAVRLVDRLEHDGLVRRTRPGGRAVGLSLTPAGRRILRRLEHARLVATAELLSAL